MKKNIIIIISAIVCLIILSLTFIYFYIINYSSISSTNRPTVTQIAAPSPTAQEGNESTFTLQAFDIYRGSGTEVKANYIIKFDSPTSASSNLSQSRQGLETVGNDFRLSIKIEYDDQPESYYQIEQPIKLMTGDNIQIYRITKPSQKDFYYVDGYKEGKGNCGEVDYPNPAFSHLPIACNFHGIIYRNERISGLLSINCQEKQDASGGR